MFRRGLSLPRLPLLLLLASLANADRLLAPSPNISGAPSPSSPGGGGGGDGGDAVVCAYSANASLTYNASDADHCCECFHSTCDLVRANCPLGTGGTSLFNYFSLQYCALGEVQPISYVFLCIVTIVVFSLLGTTADNFFVVQLETLSQHLKLSPSTAAITLLALGNSAPDVFGDLAAVQGNDDFPLALGELLGASMFLTTVVLASVILYATQDGKECKVDSEPIRDIISFAVVLAAVFVFAVTDDKITSVEAISIIGAYIIYVICVIVYTRNHATAKSPLHRISSMFEDEEGAYGTRKSIQDHLLANGLAAINNEGELEIGNVATQVDTDSDGDSEDGGDDAEELVGLDWDASATTYEKFTFILEYPFSFLRWISIAGADNAWSRRRRILTHIVPMGATTIVFLDFSPNWTGGTAYDGFASSAYGIAMLLSFCVGATMFQLSNDDTLPKWNPILVALAFVSTVAWLDLLGNECVAVLESIGTITGLTTTPQGHSILGVTVLSWANSIGDFIADTAVTRAGKPEMGVSAVFGAPMLTCCLGIGISTLIGCFSNGNGFVVATLDSELALSFMFMAVSLVSSLTAIVKSGYNIPRWYAFYLFGLYAAYMLFSVLTVTQVYSLIPGRAATGDAVDACPKF